MTRYCLIGPTYPYRGGIAHYTTLLARELRHNHEVLFISFSQQYPRWLFPGKSDRDPSKRPLRTEAEYLLNPLNPLNAYCKCDIIRDKAFVTYGGDCNLLTCDNGYWSGATVESYIEASTILSEKMGIIDFPVVYCPGMKPKTK